MLYFSSAHISVCRMAKFKASMFMIFCLVTLPFVMQSYTFQLTVCTSRTGEASPFRIASSSIPSKLPHLSSPARLLSQHRLHHLVSLQLIQILPGTVIGLKNRRAILASTKEATTRTPSSFGYFCCNRCIDLDFLAADSAFFERADAVI